MHSKTKTVQVNRKYGKKGFGHAIVCDREADGENFAVHSVFKFLHSCCVYDIRTKPMALFTVMIKHTLFMGMIVT